MVLCTLINGCVYSRIPPNQSEICLTVTSASEEVAPHQVETKSHLRTGCMAAFTSFREFQQYSDEILDLLEDFSSPAFINNKVG